MTPIEELPARDILARWQILDDVVFNLMQQVRKRISDLHRQQSLEDREKAVLAWRQHNL